MVTDKLEWICVYNISLKMSEYEAICNGHRFSNMHINNVQRILANQFPSFVRFNSTLKQCHNGKWINKYIQIFFYHGCHLITATTVGCREGVVNIALFDDVDDTLKRAISEIYQKYFLITG